MRTIMTVFPIYATLEKYWIPGRPNLAANCWLPITALLSLTACCLPRTSLYGRLLPAASCLLLWGDELCAATRWAAAARRLRRSDAQNDGRAAGVRRELCRLRPPRRTPDGLPQSTHTHTHNGRNDINTGEDQEDGKGDDDDEEKEDEGHEADEDEDDQEKDEADEAEREDEGNEVEDE